VLFLATLLTLFGLHFALKLKLESSLTDTLPQNLPSVQLLQDISEKFGGLGHLSVVLHSPNPEQNESALLQLVKKLEDNPNIHILDYKKERDFLFQNKLLYIQLEDLEQIEERIESYLWEARTKYNPIVVNLLDKEATSEAFQPGNEERDIDFKDLEEKYFGKLKTYLGTSDRTTLLLRLFPSFDISDITQSKELYVAVQNSIASLPDSLNNIEWHFAGDVLENIQNEGRLLSEIKTSLWVSLSILFVCILLFFIRIPVGPILAFIPLAMGLVWTLALTYFLVGHFNFITLSLGVILWGLGLDSCLHLLARYQEEKRKNLSAEVAFETVTLETGPSIATGALTSAVAFFAITITDFKGFHEFGIIAGVGMLCTFLAVILVYPSLLIVLESKGLVPILGPKNQKQNQFKPKAYKHWKYHLAGLLLVSAALLNQGVQTYFEYDLQKLSFPNQNIQGDSLIQASGEALVSPTVVLAPSQEEAQRIAQTVRTYMEQDSLSPTIHSVMSLGDLLPKDQEEKLDIIQKIKTLVTPKVLKQATGNVKENLLQLKQSWDQQEIELQNLPQSFIKKFSSKGGDTEAFVFVFPSVNLDHGLNAVAFAEDTKEVQLQDTVYHTSGMAVIYSDLLGFMIPDTAKALLLTLLTVFILVLLNNKNLLATLVVFTPLILGILWTLGFMKLIHLEISYYNLIVLPAMIGIGIDNSVHLYHRYLEEGQGSLYFVLKRTGWVIWITTFTTAAGFLGLLLSSHGGLLSMGVTAVAGLGFTLLASYLFIPAILGYLDARLERKEP
jgi:predicted RND superfamily exporter protein